MFLARYHASSLLSLLLLVGTVWLPSSVSGQDVTVELRFLVDTFAIGKPVPLYMEIRHPDSVAVIFPDRKQFAPFELVSLEVDPTETKDQQSRDAVVYMVRSFTMRDTQRVSLSYAFALGTDTVRRQLRSDYIRLNYRTTETDTTQSLALRSIDSVWQMATPADFSWVGLVVLGFLLLCLLTITLLRKPIRRVLHIRRNRQEWASVRKRLTRLSSIDNQASLFDQLNQLWKQYLDPREEVGLRSMTTTELRAASGKLPASIQARQKLLVRASEMADQVIYAGQAVADSEVQMVLWELQDLMLKVFEQREKQIRQM